ncbi:MAG: hypothetical protein IJW35_01410, partial [Lentisphaeria bacterium]|nr:hypothetical protein [Lentisphaeria bacterium]
AQSAERRAQSAERRAQSAERRAQSVEKSHLKLSKKQSAGVLYILCGLFIYGDYLIFPPEQFRRHLLC